VVNGIWSLSKLSNLEFSQRRVLLGLDTSTSNNQIKGKTAFWFSRPLTNVVVETIEKQELLSAEDIAELKQSTCYYDKDKVT
jgi:hypothetical protein